MGGFSQNHSRHDPTGSAIYKGFAGVTIIENERSVNRRDSALVSPVLHPFTYAFIYSFGMEKPWGQGLGIIGWSKAERIHVEDELGTLARSEGVPVDAHDPG
jgi:hypothetical protein